MHVFFNKHVACYNTSYIKSSSFTGVIWYAFISGHGLTEASQERLEGNEHRIVERLVHSLRNKEYASNTLNKNAYHLKKERKVHLSGIIRVILVFQNSFYLSLTEICVPSLMFHCDGNETGITTC